MRRVGYLPSAKLTVLRNERRGLVYAFAIVIFTPQADDSGRQRGASALTLSRMDCQLHTSFSRAERWSTYGGLLTDARCMTPARATHSPS